MVISKNNNYKTWGTLVNIMNKIKSSYMVQLKKRGTKVANQAFNPCQNTLDEKQFSNFKIL
jgi:hypothetical protein